LYAISVLHLKFGFGKAIYDQMGKLAQKTSISALTKFKLLAKKMRFKKRYNCNDLNGPDISILCKNRELFAGNFNYSHFILKDL
jgi:hypothetical protein